jgi:uncharacterized protein (TIGR02145 family)
MPISGSTVSEKQPLEIKRNALYNLEEIKVRWKKAALENCTGVPCVVAPPAPSFTCGTSTISDIDENSYNTVLIGTQCWTKENLKVTKYNDGTLIPDETANAGWGGLTTGARSNFTGVVSFIATYGYLYNWYAATDTKKLCPTGWHVPTDIEWTNLTTYLGGTNIAGGKMKSTSLLWNSPNIGADNSSEFSALPGGFRFNDGGFYNSGFSVLFLSATELTSNNAIMHILNNGNSFFNIAGNPKVTGASVRCLKD